MKLDARDPRSQFVRAIRVDGVVFENVYELNTDEGWADYVFKKEHWEKATVLRVEGKVEIEWEDEYDGPEKD